MLAQSLVRSRAYVVTEDLEVDGLNSGELLLAPLIDVANHDDGISTVEEPIISWGDGSSDAPSDSLVLRAHGPVQSGGEIFSSYGTHTVSGSYSRLASRQEPNGRPSRAAYQFCYPIDTPPRRLQPSPRRTCSDAQALRCLSFLPIRLRSLASCCRCSGCWPCRLTTRPASSTARIHVTTTKSPSSSAALATRQS